MRKIYSIFVAIATLVLAACSTDTTSDFNYTVMGEDVTLEFNASVSADSRTQLSGNSIHWNAEDAIAVFAFDGTTYSAPAKFTIKNADNYTTSAVATFTGQTVTAKSYLAVYPYSEALQIVGSTLNANIPTVQSAVKDSFDPAAALAVAVTTSAELEFKNLCSYLKVTAANDGTVTVQSNDGTTFTGDITVAGFEITPAIESTSDTTVTLTGCQSGDTYYIATAPATIEGGIALYNNGGIVRQTANAVTLEKGKIHDMGDNAYPAAVPGLVIVGSHNNWDINSGTPLYEIGGYYVAYCTTLGNEFKFVNGEAWIGGSRPAEENTPINEWQATLSENGGNNIHLSESLSNVEVYIKKNFSSFYINTSSAPMQPFTLSLIGAIESLSMNWDSDLTLKYDSAKALYYTTGVTIAAGEEFKIRACKDWNESYGASAEGTFAVNADTITKVVNNGSNLTVTASGSYDIYFNYNTLEFYLLTAGNSPENITPTPEPTNWGVVGSFNEWGTNVALQATTTEGLYVAKDIVLEQFAEFKFREGDNWDGNNFGAEFSYTAPNSVVNAISQGGNCSVAQAGTYDLYLDMTNEKIYIMTAGTEITNAVEQTANGQGPVIVPDANWGIVGSFNDWNANVAAVQTSTVGLYVVEGIALDAFAEFKFRDGETWEGRNFGAEFGYSAPNSVVNAVENGTTNCSVAQAGTYDLYLDTLNLKIYIMSAGTDIANATIQSATGQGPVVEVNPEASEWGIVGSFNDWKDDIVLYTTSTEGLLVAKDVTLTAYGEFKFRKNQNWDVNFGAKYAYTTPNSVVEAVSNGGNCSVTKDGVYDLYLDTNAAKIYIMTAGSDISTATVQTANGPKPNPEGVSFGIVGADTGWGNSADIAMTLDSTTGMYKATNVALTGDFKVRGNSSWDSGFNYGLKGGASVVVGQAIAVENGSNNNITVPAGTYDIYFSYGLDVVYLMTPGSVPAM